MFGKLWKREGNHLHNAHQHFEHYQALKGVLSRGFAAGTFPFRPSVFTRVNLTRNSQVLLVEKFSLLVVKLNVLGSYHITESNYDYSKFLNIYFVYMLTTALSMTSSKLFLIKRVFV